MGRLSEYINSQNNVRSSRRPRAYSNARVESNGGVEVVGFEDVGMTLGTLMTSDPAMAQNLKKAIRQLLKEARKNLSDDVKNYLKSDPRKAARAVKFAVYKRLFGGNLSILQKRAGTAGARYQLIRQRTLQPGQRGGNRIPRSDDARNRLETYYGADRGFILRFISSGTVNRVSRYGARGHINQTNMFGHIAPWHMATAAEKLAEAINEYVKEKING